MHCGSRASQPRRPAASNCHTKLKRLRRHQTPDQLHLVRPLVAILPETSKGAIFDVMHFTEKRLGELSASERQAAWAILITHFGAQSAFAVAASPEPEALPNLQVF